MKNLLVITIFFFSLSVIAEEDYRCKIYESCMDAKCWNDDLEGYDYISLRVDEGWFSKSFFVNGISRTGEKPFQRWVAKFEETRITSKEEWLTGKGYEEYDFDKVSKTLTHNHVVTQPGLGPQRLVYKYLCERTN